VKETTSCNTFVCPIDCKVSRWSAFSSCSKSCTLITPGFRKLSGNDIINADDIIEYGNKMRTRSIITTSLGGGKSCPLLKETRNCNTFLCPIDCVLSGWTSFGDCSKSCGIGSKLRTRSIITDVSNGGKQCDRLKTNDPCNKFACPVDCVVSTWSSFSSCSNTCGGGTKTRTRSIVTGASNGGITCDSLTEYGTCNTQPCPT
jgi:hypothetical protein